MADIKRLMEIAAKARETAYAPYSGFKVGAALEGKSGKIYIGCNVENAAFSATTCAERTAFCNAVSEGEREFVRIAVVGGAGEEREECAPCGVCRQVMVEFCGDDFEIALESDGGYKVYKLPELLPMSFNSDRLK